MVSGLQEEINPRHMLDIFSLKKCLHCSMRKAGMLVPEPRACRAVYEQQQSNDSDRATAIEQQRSNCLFTNQGTEPPAPKHIQ